MFNSKKFLIEMEYGEDKDDLTTWSNKEDRGVCSGNITNLLNGEISRIYETYK